MPFTTRRVRIPLRAAAGLLSAAAGVGASFLVSVLVGGGLTAITAVGGRVIDATPGAAKDWAVRTFGENIMRFRSAKTIAAAFCSVALLGAVGCSSDASTNAGGTAIQESQAPADTPRDMAAQLIGPQCAAYAEAVPDGPGSVSGMAQDPVATAASNNPLLKTLVASVSGQLNPEVNLVNTLNGDEFTVFAPVDDAFAKLPKATLAELSKPANAEALSTILTYHVIPGQIAPDKLEGIQTSVEGEEVEVTGSGDDIMVNDAKVICGGVQTANATVYLIDTVLTPPSMQ